MIVSCRALFVWSFFLQLDLLALLPRNSKRKRVSDGNGPNCLRTLHRSETRSREREFIVKKAFKRRKRAIRTAAKRPSPRLWATTEMECIHGWS